MRERSGARRARSVPETGIAAIRPAGRAIRPGLIDLYLVRGVAAPFLFILAGVAAAMMLERALRLIHELAAAGADLSYLLPLLAQLVPYYVDLALPAAFMVALVLLVARLDERLELEAMLASGLSLARIAAPLVAVGLAVGALSLVVGGWLDPHGRYRYRALKIEAVNAGRIGRLDPGAIFQPDETLAVTFDRRAADGSPRGILLWRRAPDGQVMVLSSGGGRMGFLPRERLFGLELANGLYAIDRAPPGGPLTIVAFDHLSFRLSLRLAESRWARGWDQKELTLSELIAARRDGAHAIAPRAIDAEISGRIARAAICPLLPLLVLPLAFATKKGRRALSVLLCIALLAVTHHGLNLAKNLSLAGSIDPLLAHAGAYGLYAAAALAIFVSGRHLPSHAPVHDVLKPLGGVLSRLTPGEQAPVGGQSRTLGAYLNWQIGKWSAIALVAILLLLQFVDLLERSEQFVARGMGPADMGRYALLRFAPLAQQALPVAALVGAMVAFSSLGRSREMTAIRAAGLSQWRIMTMALPVPIALSLAIMLLAEGATPPSQLRLAAWWEATEPRRDESGSEPRWFRIGGEVARAAAAGRDGRRLARVEILRRHDGRLVERLHATAAQFGPQGWTLEGATRQRIVEGAPTIEVAPRLAWPTPLRPADVAALFASPSAMPSTAAARRSLSELAPVNRGAAPFATRLHRTAAEPLAPLVMLLLALPLAFVAPRTSVAWPAMLYAGGGGLLYLVADGILTVAAQVGYLPPAVGAWAAPVIGGLVALTVLLYAER